jgi:8-oxo-dGTP pyrophosphatase MutT (NUDIX family)
MKINNGWNNNNTEDMSDIFCNNCGKPGHLYHQCKMPITSIGIIVYRINHDNNIEYLMIRRKDTLGYIDFMRGKYSVYNKDYIINMLKQMTNQEKENIKNMSFDSLWKCIWGNEHISNQYKSEELTSREKFNLLKKGILNKNEFYNMDMLIEYSNTFPLWDEPEWGFPKGRRNYQEKDYDCAIREFCEETGFKNNKLKNIQNILPFEEIFTGSNYKSYKHKYYLNFMNYSDTTNMDNFEKSEVSKMEWKTYDECILSIRPYNLEKIKLITNIDCMLKTYKIFSC